MSRKKKQPFLNFIIKLKYFILYWNREGKYVLKTKMKSFYTLSIWKTFVIFFWFLELASFFSSDSVCLLPLRNNCGKKLSLFFPLWMALKLMEVTPTHIKEEMHEKEYFCKLSWFFNLAKTVFLRIYVVELHALWGQIAKNKQTNKQKQACTKIVLLKEWTSFFPISSSELWFWLFITAIFNVLFLHNDL